MISPLAPGLLLAMPKLHDPTFARAVVLVTEHNDEGSFGIILNQKSPLPTRELLNSIDISWQGPSSAVIWDGGPVMPSSVWVLHTDSPNLPPAAETLDQAIDTTGSVHICDGLFLSTSEENMKLLAAEPPKGIRFYLGYSGWSGGQLAAEMAQGAWLHADIDVHSLFATPADALWEQCLRGMGINPDTVAQSWS